MSGEIYQLRKGKRRTEREGEGGEDKIRGREREREREADTDHFSDQSGPCLVCTPLFS